MNELSWLLYWGNVTGNLGLVFVGISAVSALGGIGFALASLDSFDDDTTKSMRRLAVTLMVISPIFMFAAALTPSQSTVYAIAASQVGEKALATPLAQKTTKALEVWLDNQIEGLKSDDD